MLPLSWLGFLYPGSLRARPVRDQHRRATVGLHVEWLEDRRCPSGSYLYVGDWDEHRVLRYDAATGAFVDEFVARRSGGLNQPYGIVLGPHDHNLYVASGQFSGNGQLQGVASYDGTTGAFLDEFTASGHLDSPRGIIFGPDGDLYVSDHTDNGGRVVRFDGTTGALDGDFVSVRSGGLGRPQGLVFGPDANDDGQLDLYVASAGTNSVLHYDGTTGAFLGEFVARGTAGLEHPIGLTFGPDGNLYVANFPEREGNLAVMRFQGLSGETPGAPLPSAGNTGADFVPAGSGGLLTPQGLLFGPDGNGDGRQDLYVGNMEVIGSLKAKMNTGTIKRYDGVTGAFIDTFVSLGSGGLRDPLFMTFTETDPVTLAYTGGSLTATAAAPGPLSEPLNTAPSQPSLTEGFARGQATAKRSGIDAPIADLPGVTLWQTIGNPLRPDDSAYTTPGDQGEPVHPLGHDRVESGPLKESQTVGNWWGPASASRTEDAVWLDPAFDNGPPLSAEGPVLGRVGKPGGFSR